VESFEDLQKDVGIAIHKPFYCSLHPGESVKFFCIGCQVRFVFLIDFSLSSFSSMKLEALHGQMGQIG